MCLSVFERQKSVWVQEDLYVLVYMYQRKVSFVMISLVEVCLCVYLCAGVCEHILVLWKCVSAASQTQRGQRLVWAVQGRCHPLTHLTMQLYYRQENKNESTHKHAGKLCIYMQTSLCRFILFLNSGIHDPRPVQNNTAPFIWLFPQLLFLFSLQVFSYFFALYSCLHALSYVPYLSIFLISSTSGSSEVIQLMNTVQSRGSTNLSMRLVIRHVVLSSATHLPHLLPFSIHPPTPSLFPLLHQLPPPHPVIKNRQSDIQEEKEKPLSLFVAALIYFVH